jgi:hypothetical protein
MPKCSKLKNRSAPGRGFANVSVIQTKGCGAKSSSSAFEIDSLCCGGFMFIMSGESLSFNLLNN